MEARLLEPEAVARLVTLMPAGTAAAGGDGEQLQALLAPMLRLLQRSPRLSVELAQVGLGARRHMCERQPPGGVHVMRTAGGQAGRSLSTAPHPAAPSPPPTARRAAWQRAWWSCSSAPTPPPH